jgi:hypothetical protein
VNLKIQEIRKYLTDLSGTQTEKDLFLLISEQSLDRNLFLHREKERAAGSWLWAEIAAAAGLRRGVGRSGAGRQAAGAAHPGAGRPGDGRSEAPGAGRQALDGEALGAAARRWRHGGAGGGLGARGGRLGAGLQGRRQAATAHGRRKERAARGCRPRPGAGRRANGGSARPRASGGWGGRTPGRPGADSGQGREAARRWASDSRRPGVEEGREARGRRW